MLKCRMYDLMIDEKKALNAEKLKNKLVKVKKRFHSTKMLYLIFRQF